MWEIGTGEATEKQPGITLAQTTAAPIKFQLSRGEGKLRALFFACMCANVCVYVFFLWKRRKMCGHLLRVTTD